MRTFFSSELGLNVVTRQGNEVFLPDDNAIVAVTFFEASGLFEVVADGIRRRGQPLCVRVESLIAALGEPEVPQGQAKAGKAKPKNRPQNSTSANETKPQNYPQNFSSTAETDTQATTKDYACDSDNDEKPTSETVRSYKSLHRSWKNCRDKLLSSANPANTVGMHVRPPEKVSFDRMSRLLPKFVRYLEKTYPTEYKGCGAFPEPDEAGDGWHAHLFPHFRNRMPDNFEKIAFKWWADQSDVEILNNDFLVKFEYFITKQQLVTALDYVNPTRGKKKKRIPLYPAGRQIMRYYGEFDEPVTVAAPFRAVKEIVGKELTSLRRSTEFINPESGEILYSRTALIFDVGEMFFKRLSERPKPDESSDLFRCRAFVAPPNGRCGECPLRSTCGWNCRLCRNQGTELCAACKHGKLRSEQRCRHDGQLLLTGF